MSTRFPVRRLPSPPLGGPELRLHAPAAEPVDPDGLGWVGWLFQSIRAQRQALVFKTEAVDRVLALADWNRFAGAIFLPVLAPALLRGWKHAHDGEDAALCVVDRELRATLEAEVAARSTGGGLILLERTRGAKYQAALGRYRARVDLAESPGHLAVVWSAIAALFQLPPLDLLAEYLRQEWLVATAQCPHHEVPQGPLSFSGLAHRALHEAGVLRFSE